MDETADDAQHALSREIVEAASEGGGAKIEIARGDAEHQRLLCRERHQLDIETFGGEITLVLCDENGRCADRLEDAESDMIGGLRPRGQKHQRGQRGEQALHKMHFHFPLNPLDRSPHQI
jgi:hypothetical protein